MLFLERRKRLVVCRLWLSRSLAVIAQTARTAAIVVVSYARFAAEWLGERLARLRQAVIAATEPASYVVLDVTQQMWCIEAHRVRIDGEGRLIFTEGIGRVVAVAEAGTWIRFARGLSLEDFNA